MDCDRKDRKQTFKTQFMWQLQIVKGCKIAKIKFFVRCCEIKKKYGRPLNTKKICILYTNNMVYSMTQLHVPKYL